MPDGTTRFSYKGQPIFHYMGCSTFSNFTVLPEIALAKIREDAPFQSACYIGCGVTTGVGAVVNTAKVQVGDNVVVFGLGGIGLNVIQARVWPARTRSSASTSTPTARNGVAVRHDRLQHPWHEPRGYRGQDRPDDRWRRRLHFDATGNTEVMRTALEACHRGWGTSIIIGVAEAGKTIETRPFQLVTGRNWRGTAFGQGPHRCAQDRRHVHAGKIEIDPMITHVMGLEDINTAFDLMHEGKSSARSWCSETIFSRSN
jgi:S-(hydroxymethyl)glutathione dehydrogenase/alcohol dehydrogenase